MAATETDMSPEELIGLLSDPTDADKALIRKAYEFAQDAHKEHKRNSGEPYFTHLYAAALALAELDMDAQTVAAGLLHDTIEDTPVTAEDVQREFGSEILFLVESVTKLGELKYRGAARHIESLRRLFVATSQDIRVLMVKFMDRRHNMQTLEYVPEEKRERIARETLEVYAPLADRLGMGELKRELEDLSFRWVFPDEYEKIEDIMRENKLAKEPQLEKVAQKLKTALAEHGVKGFRTEARVKGYYSLYQKCKRKGGDIDKIHDLLAIRIILDSVEDCYRALGVVHTLWHPLPGKIKDYIAFHKPNGYRSIHTTVVTEAAGPVEIQLRTEAMHQEAQYGIASHLSYKEAGSMPDRGEQKKNKLWYAQLIPSLLKSTPKRVAKSVNSPKWMEDLAAAHKVEEEDEHGSTDSYLQAIREDFFTHRIFVFTPRGDVIDLPLDSTPIDFAYAIHSEIGERTSGAKVNGKLVSLTSQLHNGDIVEIETKDNARPTKKWLEHVRTSVAKKHITQTLAKMRKGEDVS